MLQQKEAISEANLRRRRLLYCSHHRGMREMDLILGAFADACMQDLSDEELKAYETLLELPDDELFVFFSRGDSGLNFSREEYNDSVAQKILLFLQSIKFPVS